MGNTNVILFGNGLNLLSDGCPTWGELLKDISNKDNYPILDGIPMNLQYEQVYLSPKASFSELSNESDEFKLKTAVKRRLRKIKSNPFYNEILKLDVDIFLTTNYDHTLYRGKGCKVLEKDSHEKLYSIRRWKKVVINKREKFIYHIHGDISGVSSIVLGLDHYGGSLAKIQDFVKGNYYREIKSKSSKKTYPKVPSILHRISSGDTLNPVDYGFTDSGTGLLSWIDAFFFKDIHIIGLSLDFSEIDIWWLLSRRARYMKSHSVNNSIFYYPTFPMSEIQTQLSKLRLLERLKVNIVHHKQTSDIETGNPCYEKIYEEQIGNLKSGLK